MTEYHSKDSLRITNYPRGRVHNDDPLIQSLFQIIHDRNLSYHSVEQVGKLPQGQISRVKEGANARYTTIVKLAATLGYKLVLQRLD